MQGALPAKRLLSASKTVFTRRTSGTHKIMMDKVRKLEVGMRTQKSKLEENVMMTKILRLENEMKSQKKELKKVKN
jgi:hypothetical protein